MEPRRYRDSADWRAMLDLLAAGRRAANGTYYVHTGDVSWWLYYHGGPDPFADQIWLWEDAAGRLLGWVLFTPDGGYFDLFVQPELCGTAAEAAMHLWAEAQITARVRALGGRHIRVFWIEAGDTLRQARLEGRGFARGADAMNYMEQGLTDLAPAAPVPAGFTVRPVSLPADLEARPRASYGAFRSTWEWERYRARYERFTQSPVYSAERDLVAAGPGGVVAAFTVWWVDEANGLGYFEPVGTHPDYQRRGLGRAVLQTALRQMRALGLRRAGVCTYISNPGAVAFYEACGFRTAARLWLYEKSIDLV